MDLLRINKDDPDSIAVFRDKLRSLDKVDSSLHRAISDP